MIQDTYFSDSKYFELIRRGTGLLNGVRRFERIKGIALINIILAARCKNTCIDYEDEICDFIIENAKEKIIKYDDPASIVAILELGEYLELGGILKLKYQINLDDNLLKIFTIDETDLNRVLFYISDKMPKELLRNIFNIIRESRIDLNTEYYNALLNISSNNIHKEIYMEMKQLGINPDSKTFEILFNKCTNFKTANEYLSDLSEFYPNTILKKAILLRMIILSTSLSQSLPYYYKLNDLMNQKIGHKESKNEIAKNPKKYKSLFIAISVLIKLSRNEEIAKPFFDRVVEFGYNKYNFICFFNYYKKIKDDDYLESIIIRNILTLDVGSNKTLIKPAIDHFNQILTLLVYKRKNDKLILSTLRSLRLLGYKPESSIVNAIINNCKNEDLIRFCMLLK